MIEPQHLIRLAIDRHRHDRRSVNLAMAGRSDLADFRWRVREALALPNRGIIGTIGSL